MTRPFHGQFVVRKLGLSMIKLSTKFEVSTFTHYTKIWKAMQNAEIGAVLEVRGYPRSSVT